MNEVIKFMLERMLLFNEDVKGTYEALRARGLSREQAENEISRAFLGCQWEANNGMPNRWPTVLQALRDGRSALELFAYSLYHHSGQKH